MRRLMAGRRRLLIVAGAVSLGAAGMAYAAIPGANGVISGCYDLKTGMLRVLDSEAGASCTASKEAAISWNQTGPQGPQGAQGPAGTAAAYATIRWDASAGTVVVSPNARGITAANVTRPRQGVYCLEGLSFQPQVAVGSGAATIRPTGTNPDGSLAFDPSGFDTTVTTQITQEGSSWLVFCDDGPAAPNPTVRIYVAQAGVGLVDRQFSILLDD